MNSRRSRRALVFVHAPHAEHGAGGAFLCYHLWWSWLRSNPAFELTSAFGELLNFHVRLVCAHSPNSPVGAASAPFWGVVGWGGTSASPNWARRASDCAIFSLASACRASAFCIASRVARFFLLASQPRQRSLSLASLRSPQLRGGIEHRTLRCCDFHSVLLLCLPLCASVVVALALVGPFRNESRLVRDSRLGNLWLLL